MFIFHKWHEDSHTKYGINYASDEDGDIEIAIKIPLWVFWREMYLDFETKTYKSGKTIQGFMIYIRRRSDDITRKTGQRWILDCMFGLSPYGKQKMILRRCGNGFVKIEGLGDEISAGT